MRLPPLRHELTLHVGPPHIDGSPTWLIYDPHRTRYFQIGWVLFEIVRRWEERESSRVITRVNEETTLALSEDDVRAAIQFLYGNELLRAVSEKDTKTLIARWKASRHGLLTTIVHNYLFFRIPLLHPDRFLAATLAAVRPLGGAAFAVITVAALLVGLVLAARQWSNLVAQLGATMTFDGLLGYAIAIAFAKTTHELAHAYVAKAHGCRVATMGLAFLVLYPVPYTDTNDAWRVRSRRGRLAIASAGMIAELYIAAWATLLWSFLPDGPAKSATLTLAATTWVMSLAVNASPIMRFDGYYILSDLCDMPNLHARAFAFGRWRLREILFDLREPPPEALSRRKRRLLIAFAYIVWIYRLVIFIGIALLVYHFFIKIIGILLFCIEITWFVMMPMGHELRQWWTRRAIIVGRARFLATTSIMIALLLLLAIPWSGRIDAPALLRAERLWLIFPVANAEITRVHVSEGANVRAGDRLFDLISPTLSYQIEDNKARLALLEKQLHIASFDETYRAQMQYLREKLISARTERDGLVQQTQKLEIVAPFDGQIFDLQPDLRVGQPISHKQKLAVLRTRHDHVAIGFVGEEKIGRVAIGQSAVFYPETIDRPVVRMKIVQIEQFAARSIDHPTLTSKFGGPIEVSEKDRALHARAALYKVTARPVTGSDPDAPELRGTLQIEGAPESLLVRASRVALSVLMRESGM